MGGASASISASASASTSLRGFSCASGPAASGKAFSSQSRTLTWDSVPFKICHWLWCPLRLTPPRFIEDLVSGLLDLIFLLRWFLHDCRVHCILQRQTQSQQHCPPPILRQLLQGR